MDRMVNPDRLKEPPVQAPPEYLAALKNASWIKHPGKGAARKVSRTRKPPEMSLQEWQIALRRSFGREATYRLKNLGRSSIFSDFLVKNPERGTSYRVAIRGKQPGENFCECPDYAVNTLGTCKHIEFALGRQERKHGGKAKLAKGFLPPYSEIFLRYGIQREIVFRAGSKAPDWAIRYARQFFGPDGALFTGAYRRLDEVVKKLCRRGHPLRFYEDARNFVARVLEKEDLARRVDSAFPGGEGDPAFENLLGASLYPYQRCGALFAARTGRCIIADEMGLGKTLQAIAATEILANVGAVERVLVVAPTSLKHQWHSELSRFCTRTAEVVEGLAHQRALAYGRPSFYKILNYDVVHRDLERIRAWAPDLVILDEAQRIKNWQTRTAKTVKKLDSEHAIVLTGTPLENRIEELHSIVEFVDRHHLGPRFRFLAEHQEVDDNGRVIGYRNLTQIARTLQPILLRRTKAQVMQELPKRIEKRLFFPMTPQQMGQHEENRDVVARIVMKWRRFGFLAEKDQKRLMIALQYMRMACDSTYLADLQTDHGVKADELAVRLGELLAQPETKVVVFSQWKRMLDLVVHRLKRSKIGHVLFHGGVPGRKRKDLIQTFREDPACRVFLSTDAGGVGLNLQHASVVMNLDLPWNPAVLEQRIGRVHRLGQRRPVQVFHFISEKTIEHGMLNILEFKKSVFAGALDGKMDEVMLGGTRLKRFMESVESATCSIPEGSAGRAAGPGVQGSADTGAQWTKLIASGRSFLDALEGALKDGGGARTGTAAPFAVETDARSGERFLKMPLPTARQFKELLALFGAMAKAAEPR